MKKTKQEELLQILTQSTDWISSSSLATLMGVSQRTIRNYVNAINSNALADIESSKSGYKLNKKVPASIDKEPLMDERIYFIMSKLLACPTGVSVFDLSEGLSVSESTIINICMPKIKNIILPFNLTIQSQNYDFFLNGSERDKRKMIGYLVTHNNYGYFTSGDTLEKIFPNFNIKDLMKNLYKLFDQSTLFINNFAMNNLLIHILIILIRVNSNDRLTAFEKKEEPDFLANFKQKKDIIELADRIHQYFEDHFSIKIPEKDYQQIILLIFLSTNYDVNSLKSIIDTSFISSIEQMVTQVSQRYTIDPFDQEFISQLTLHMYNARERSQFDLSYPNPIAKEVKREYAPIYDMAVYFAHLFSKKYAVTLSESEIAFITFHFGAYLENNQNYQASISCIIIVEDYLNLSKTIVQQIEKKFQQDLAIRQVMSLNQFMVSKPECDLLISIVDVPIQHPHIVTISPIITNKNFIDIQNELDYLNERKKMSRAGKYLRSWFNEAIYFRNIQLDSPTEYIQFMGEKCLENHFIQPNFIEDVLLRESVSSTAFTDCLAVPHTISQHAEVSFICVIHNDVPLQWTNNKVNFILMIGITQSDMKYFNDAFNLLIEFFLTPDNQIKLLGTKNFSDFVNTLLPIS